MAVDVRNISTGHDDTYPTATAITVTEGHLHVQKVTSGSSRRTTVAIYAPSQWRHAEVKES